MGGEEEGDGEEEDDGEDEDDEEEEEEDRNAKSDLVCSVRARGVEEIEWSVMNGSDCS